MLKKFGMVTVGVTAGMLAMAPIASASVVDVPVKDEAHGKADKGDHKKDRKDGHHKKDRHGKHHGKHHGDQHGTGNVKCDAEGGDFDSSADGSLAGVAAPIGSGNNGQLLSCNSFLNDFLNDNEVNVLSAP